MTSGPLFSASLGWTLLEQSPAHAYHAISQPTEPTEAMDVGDAAHAYWLEGDSAFVLIDAPDFRTRAARDARDAAHAAGKTPLLAHRWAEVQAMVATGKQQLAHIDPPGLLEPELGIAEHSLYVTLDGVACRATPDWVRLDHRLIVDLKTTGGTAHPFAFAKTLWDKGYGLQAALYRRALQQTHGVLPDWYWVVIETAPPYALSVVGLDPEAAVFADAQLTAALAQWRRCVETNHWPAYPMRPCYAEVPAYIQAQFAERTYYQQEARR